MYFCNFFFYFLTFQSHFADTMHQLNDIFSPMCLYVGFESLYSLKFFHLSRFRNQISPPNVLLGKFQHPFSTLKHYNLAIYVAKWLQIWFTSSTTHTLGLYSWNLYNLVTFRSITPQKQWCFWTPKGLGPLGIKLLCIYRVNFQLQVMFYFK